MICACGRSTQSLHASQGELPWLPCRSTGKLSGEIGFPKGFGKALDGVAEHGSGYGCQAGLQIGLEDFPVAFSDFAQHPSDGLVDQVVRMRHEPVGDRQRMAEIAVADELHRRHDRNAVLPERAGGRCHLVEKGAILAEKPVSQQLIAGKIDEIPVVDEFRVAKIGVDALALFFRTLLRELEPVDKHEKSREADFVVRRCDKAFDFGE